jgi:DsbC/DsbD-like thiol-disulfide interchange protein
VKLAIAFTLLSVTGAAHAADPAKYMSAQLVADTQSPKPGGTILVGFSMIPQPGWHGYWSNPGDSGIAPSVRWSLPSGLSAGSLQHPPPKLLLADGLSSFVHTGPHILLTRIKVARSVAVGTRIPVQAELNWAACTESQCVPLHETFSLDLVAGNGTPGPYARSLADAQSRIPRSGFHGTFSTSGRQVRLAIPES